MTYAEGNEQGTGTNTERRRTPPRGVPYPTPRLLHSGAPLVMQDNIGTLCRPFNDDKEREDK